MNKILLVEDETGLRLALADRLTAEGYHVVEAKTGSEGLELGRNERINLIILDVMLPEVDGFAICQNLRAEGITTPIIILSAKTLQQDKLTGLKLGADDYVSKPFDMNELIARVEVQFRRGQALKETQNMPEYQTPELVINLRRGFMLVKGEEVPLLAQEIRLLDYMFLHEREILSRKKLLEEVWGYEAKEQLNLSTRTIDVHVARLRQKMGDIGDSAKYIQTIRGIGYKFIAP